MQFLPVLFYLHNWGPFHLLLELFSRWLLSTLAIVIVVNIGY